MLKEEQEEEYQQERIPDIFNLEYIDILARDSNLHTSKNVKPKYSQNW